MSRLLLRGLGGQLVEPKNYQEVVNSGGVPSEQVIQSHERNLGRDYRSLTEGKHPIAAARS